MFWLDLQKWIQQNNFCPLFLLFFLDSLFHCFSKGIQKSFLHTPLCLKPSEYFKCYSQLFEFRITWQLKLCCKTGSKKKPLLTWCLTMDIFLEMLSSHHCYDVYRVPTMNTGEKSWEISLTDIDNTGLWPKQMMGSPIYGHTDIVPWAQAAPFSLIYSSLGFFHLFFFFFQNHLIYCSFSVF